MERIFVRVRMTGQGFSRALHSKSVPGGQSQGDVTWLAARTGTPDVQMPEE